MGQQGSVNMMVAKLITIISPATCHVSVLKIRAESVKCSALAQGPSVYVTMH